MNETIMISLVGEQPIPNLLAVLYAKPVNLVWVCTDRTKIISQRLCSVLKERNVSVEDEPINVAPYDMVDIESKLKAYIEEKKWEHNKIIFNLTGGTKPMALAAYRLAEQFFCPFLYVQSEGKKSVVYYYQFAERGPELKNESEIPPVLDIDLYIKAYHDNYTETNEFKNEFEKMVHAVLKAELDEVKNSVKPVPYGGLEIDLVLRCGNQVGIVEVKSGDKAKKKRVIEQLITAAEQRFLGTYIEKFIILDCEYEEKNNRQLADAHRITVIELPSAQNGELSEEDRRKLVDEVKKALGG
ncbi:Card1-like endonuclease domain-containing protein [Pelotomaculum propionicicum]|uniref:Card1 CARF domain-containing protein n=1 Tax=Pelotomaculum propionicicum TaxID=258475 RepID=A0A4Y7RK29_9FIRM|nr:DUF1887 family CARF protein [Pelotomaculum propionicicum]TEB09032.1 hypothetical protein Pmgp_03452 [Pelotomaculum propionicicum]